MQILLNLIRILLTIAWTTVVGTPVVLITYATYVVGRIASWLGREDLFTAILARNAWVMSVVAKHLWAPVLLRFSGVTTWSEETQAIDWRRSCVICCNHASVFDILALVRALPVPVRFVAKRELVKWPVIGWSLRPAGQIIVDRQHRDKALQSMQEATRHKMHGQVIFFVEGTRTRNGELQPFKRGAFHFALANQMPALPVAVVGSFSALARLPWWRLHPGRRIGVVFGTPIEPTARPEAGESAQADQLMTATRMQMEGLLQRYEEEQVA